MEGRGGVVRWLLEEPDGVVLLGALQEAVGNIEPIVSRADGKAFDPATLDRHPADGARWRPARPVAAILDGALAAWRGGHPTPAAVLAGDAIALVEPRLAWFYANRTRHVGTPAAGGG